MLEPTRSPSERPRRHGLGIRNASRGHRSSCTTGYGRHRTGSHGLGKTAAFGLPILERCQPTGSLQALVLAPTRELANQVAEEFKLLQGDTGLTILTVYGGTDLEKQAKTLGKGLTSSWNTRSCYGHERGVATSTSLHLNFCAWMKPTACWTWGSSRTSCGWSSE